MRRRSAAARMRCRRPCCPAGAGRMLLTSCCPSLMGGLQVGHGRACRLLPDIVFCACWVAVSVATLQEAVLVNIHLPHARGATQAAAPALAEPKGRLCRRHVDWQERLVVALLQCCRQPGPGRQFAAWLCGLLRDQQARRAVPLLSYALAACASSLKACVLVSLCLLFAVVSVLHWRWPFHNLHQATCPGTAFQCLRSSPRLVSEWLNIIKVRLYVRR